jgi:hypothetical protein
VAFAISVLALAVAVWSLVVGSRQLSVARSASGGRALVFIAGRTGKIAQPVRFENELIVEVPEFFVRFAVGGPGVFHHGSVRLFGAVQDENSVIPTPPEQRITMSAAGEPIEWEFRLPDFESAAGARVVVNSWAAHAAAAEPSDWGSHLRSPLRSHLLSTSTGQR